MKAMTKTDANRAYYAANRERLVEQARQRRKERSEEIRARDRARYAANPERKKAQSAASAKRCADRKREYNKRWRAENPSKARETRRVYMAIRRQLPHVALSNRIRCGIYDCLRRGKNGRAWTDLVGWSIHDIADHLERQFLPGMGWHNMGEWHSDHIVPLSSFTITGSDDPELRRAWALPNLRPLWGRDNIRKGSRRELLL